jgi:hypothetical protein
MQDMDARPGRTPTAPLPVIPIPPTGTRRVLATARLIYMIQEDALAAIQRVWRTRVSRVEART